MEVRPEWAKCCCCKLSVSKSSGRLKWCADSEKWKHSKCIKLMLTTTIILLPVAVVSLSIIKYTNSSQKPLNVNPLEFERSEAFETNDMAEGSRPKIIRDLHMTSCFPTSNSYYSVRTKRNLDNEAYTGNITQDIIIWQIPSQDSDMHRSPNIEISESQNNLAERKEKILNSTLLQTIVTSDERVGKQLTGNYDVNNSEEKYENMHLEDNVEAPTSQRNPKSRDNFQGTHTKSEEAINVLYDEKNNKDSGQQVITEELWNKTEHQRNINLTDQADINENSQSNNSRVLGHLFWISARDKDTTRKVQAKLMTQYMDFRADPCQDFYQYACGNWGVMNPIPKDRANFDTFEKLRESLDYVLKEILEEDISRKDISAYIKAKHFYKSCVNYEILENRGVEPLIDLLNSFGSWPIISPGWNSSTFSWLELMAKLRLYNNDILISYWIGPDIKNSNEYVIQFDQTSLGLPTRDYYLQPSNRVYVEAYENFLFKIATLLGATPEVARADAADIVAFETDLAKITSAPDERRNVSGLYQRMRVETLNSYVPQVDWQRFLTIVLNRTCNGSEPVVIFALRYVQDLVSLLNRTSPRTVANYLLWRFVRHRVNNLDDRFQEAKQTFYYTLVGRERPPPRWKYCVTQVNSNMGVALGAMFVKKYFDQNSKNDTLSMTREIQLAFNEILLLTSWLSSETKIMATEKVDGMTLRVGYPDFILITKMLNDRFKDVVINPDKYFENTLNLLRHATKVEQLNLGTTVNKSIWSTAPAIVNAYYSRNKNQIMFPAGILQPPFYHRHFPRSLNYGGIGVVIGHEITHGFDDKGRHFDKSGNLFRWWKDEEIRSFHDRAQCLIEQYGNYTVKEVGISLDGINTQGENIADNGGIKQAFRAYQRWLSIHGNKDETLPGLNATEYQLFFLNFAQVWCGHARPEASKNGLKTAVHSPGRFRVIGTLSNNEEFARVYQCLPGTPMNPLQKCSVW